MNKEQIDVYFGAIKQIVKAEGSKEKRLELFNLLKITDGYRNALDSYHAIRDLQRRTRYPLFLKDPQEGEHVISDESAAGLLAGTGNSEAKALIFGSMQPEVAYFSRDLFDLSRRIQGARPGWIQGHAVAHQYCIKSFEPQGLVEEVENPQTNSRGFIKTTKGETEGDNLASLAVLFSLNHVPSLYALVGGNQSEKQRGGRKEGGSHIMTGDLIKIYRVLAGWIKEEKQLRENDPEASVFPKRQADLLLEFDITQSRASIALRHLSIYGIIDYEFADSTKRFTGYKASSSLVEGHALPHRLYPGLPPTDVLTIMRQNADRYLTVDDIYNELVEAYPKYFRDTDKDIKAIKTNILHIVGFYKGRGFLEAKDFDSRTRSTIELTDTQKQVVLEFANLLDHFQAQDPRAIEYARQAFGSLSQEQISDLMKKARDASQQVDRVSSEDEENFILSILLTHPNLRVRQLQQTLMNSFKKKISHARTINILRAMSKKGLVGKTDTIPTMWSANTLNSDHSESEAE